jgi:heat shock protein HslJ
MKAWKGLVGLACCALAYGIGIGSVRGAETEFPFDSELILDVDPMPGSKRIPNMDVAANGAIALEMWCNRIEGQIIVAGDTITVLTRQATSRECPPERLRGDEELLAALTQATNWRREGPMVLLIGPRPLRFRVPTN